MKEWLITHWKEIFSCSKENRITSLIVFITTSLSLIFILEIVWISWQCWLSCSDEHYLNYLLQNIVYLTTQTSIILMVVTFIYLSRIAYCLNEESKKQPSENNEQTTESNQQKTKNNVNLFSKLLTEVLIGSLSTSAIPTGISLTICAFYDINFIKYMSGVEIYIAFAGISLISIGFLSTDQEHEQMEKSKKIGDPSEL